VRGVWHGRSGEFAENGGDLSPSYTVHWLWSLVVSGLCQESASLSSLPSAPSANELRAQGLAPIVLSVFKLSENEGYFQERSTA